MDRETITTFNMYFLFLFLLYQHLKETMTKLLDFLVCGVGSTCNIPVAWSIYSCAVVA